MFHIKVFLPTYVSPLFFTSTDSRPCRRSRRGRSDGGSSASPPRSRDRRPWKSKVDVEIRSNLFVKESSTLKCVSQQVMLCNKWFWFRLPLHFPHGDHALGRALPQREKRGRALQPQRRRQCPPIVLKRRISTMSIRMPQKSKQGFLVCSVKLSNECFVGFQCYLARRGRGVQHGAEPLPHVARQPEA